MHVESKCAACPLRACGQFDDKPDEMISYIQEFKIGEMQIEAGAVLFNQGNAAPHLYTVLEGVGLKQQVLLNGARQVLNFAVPGDLLGLQSAILGDTDHSTIAKTDMRFCLFSKDRLWELFRDHPALSYDITWLAAREESVLNSLLANTGQRTAATRVAYLLMHYAARWLRHQGERPTSETKINFPFTQDTIADAVGITAVHTNRTLRELAKKQLLTLQRRKLSILDWDGLSEFVGWDETRDNPEKRILL